MRGMIRIASILVFAGLVVALFLVPGVSPSRLATKQAGDLVMETVTVENEDGTTSESALWQEIFASNAVQSVTTEEGKVRRVLRVGGQRFLTDILREGEKHDPLWHAEAGKSVVRQLRSVAAEENIDIEVEAFKKPDPSGFNLEAQVSEGEYRLTTNVDGAVIGERTMVRREVSRLSLLPPLVAIFLAILFRRPVLALFMGVWSGSFLVRYLTAAHSVKLAALEGTTAAAESAAASAPSTWQTSIESLREVLCVYLHGQLVQRSRTEIILFVVFMLAMVGILTRAGGIRGIMNRIAVLARDARKTQIASWLMGLVIFFDDYANTILVGSTMRPLADKFRVAREKLAYIVDSTAAPVAGISILSTWIAFEVSTFSAQLPDAGLGPSDGYAVFLQTLPYRFYCWFTLMFVGMVVLSGRDFGPMLTAERRARRGQVLREGATPLVGEAATELEADARMTPAASTAIVPLAVFISTTLGTIIYKGLSGLGFFAESGSEKAVALEQMGLLEILTGILYEGSGELPLMLGAIAGFLVAAFIALSRGLGVAETTRAAWNSLRAMGVAIVILYLAWMVGQTCDDLGTAAYLSATLSSSTPYVVLPVVLFLLSGLIAFSTGSSWSTMTILLPLVVGLSYDVGYQGNPTDADPRVFALLLMTISIGAVLEGAIFGDHCSPISDTTVMSSIACASDHVDHVRTQAPYALVTMAVALGVGYLPVTFFGVSPWVSLVAGGVVLFLILRLRGERADDDPGARTGPTTGSTIVDLAPFDDVDGTGEVTLGV